MNRVELAKIISITCVSAELVNYQIEIDPLALVEPQRE